MNIGDLIRIQVLFAEHGVNASRFLEVILLEDENQEKVVKLYSFRDEASLYKRDSVGEDEIVEITGGFYEVYPEKVYSAIMNGEPLLFNYLRTEEPICDWDPNADPDGLFYDAPPVEVEKLFIKKEDMGKFTEEYQSVRPYDITITGWHTLTINGEARPLTENMAIVLKFLYEKSGDAFYSTTEVLATCKNVQKMDQVVKRTQNLLVAQLIEYGNGHDSARGTYRASELLRDATILAK